MWDLGKSVSFVVEKLQGIGDESGCLVFCLISPLPFALELLRVKTEFRDALLPPTSQTYTFHIRE